MIFQLGEVWSRTPHQNYGGKSSLFRKGVTFRHLRYVADVKRFKVEFDEKFKNWNTSDHFLVEIVTFVVAVEIDLFWKDKSILTSLKDLDLTPRVERVPDGKPPSGKILYPKWKA